MIVDLSTYSLPQEEIFILLRQSNQCPPLSPSKYHSLVLQLPKHHRMFVKLLNGFALGLISVMHEQRLSDGGQWVAHITEFETRCEEQFGSFALELLEHAIDHARRNNCCRIIAPGKEVYASAFETLEFDCVDGFYQKTIRPYF